ncbi:MAG: DUF1987 domain-containing protein [Crocinitomicaceae bacterium]|jgi:hypothetical protein
MTELKLTQTESTPFVFFQKNGILEISGKVIPDSDIDFWTPISSWFNGYLENPAANTIFRLRIDYLNTSSSKEILHMLYRLNELKDRGFFASVQWEYNDGDFDMLEVGRDYEHMVKVPFEFLVLSENPCV